MAQTEAKLIVLADKLDDGGYGVPGPEHDGRWG
jgi:hypothetical protein